MNGGVKIPGVQGMVKMAQFHRMNANKKRGGKDSSEKNDKSSSRRDLAQNKSKRPMNRLRKSKKDDDDESLDSKGNIRGLIDYSDEEEFETSSADETSPSDELTEKSTIAKRVAKRSLAKKKKPIKKSTPKSEVTDDEEEEDETDYVPTPKKKAQKRKPKRKVVESESEEEDEEDEEDDDVEDEEDDDEEDDEEEDEDEEDEEYEGGRGGISISFGTLDDPAERLIPRRHNMKKESEIVKKFVKLVTKPMTENTIDDQIDQFKTMPEDKQKQMIEALERKVNPANAEKPLMFRILSMNLPNETQSMILNKYNSLQTLDPSSGEYFKLRNWLEKFTSLPLGLYKEMPVRIEDGTDQCGAFMERARRCLEEAIYGQEEAKLQILQFIASKIANPSARGCSLLLVGPPGIGKTSLIKNGIAKALDWPFQFISLGGDSDATTYTGHQLVYESSHCGKIVNSLVAAKSMSMVLMFDELDKISGTPKGEEVQNMLIHLTDPVQNADFEDKYLAGVPIDLSKVMFVFSGNDINKIDKILLDRMVVVKLNGYNAKEKQAIAEQYLVPNALREVNLAEKVGISSDVVQHIIREYAGEETGVRELKRCIENTIQKINMLRIFNSKDLPFHIKDFSLPFVVKKEHTELFLKKKEGLDVSVQRMYS